MWRGSLYKFSLLRVSSTNIISCAAGFDSVCRVCTVCSESVFRYRKGTVWVIRTDKVPHSSRWTRNFYLTTIELVLEGSSPKLHPFRHGELLKASTKESNPPPVSSLSHCKISVKMLCYVVYCTFNWMFGERFYFVLCSYCCDSMYCFFFHLFYLFMCVRVCMHRTCCVMQGIVNVVQVRDFEIIPVYKFMSIVFAFIYIFLFKKCMWECGLCLCGSG